jgi:hypothetical protein
MNQQLRNSTDAPSISAPPPKLPFGKEGGGHHVGVACRDRDSVEDDGSKPAGIPRHDDVIGIVGDGAAHADVPAENRAQEGA